MGCRLGLCERGFCKVNRQTKTTPKETTTPPSVILPMDEILPDETGSPSLANAPTAADLDLGDDVLVFVKNAYSRVNRQAKLDKLTTRQGEQLCEQLCRAEEMWGAADFRSGLISYLHRDNEWLRENHWPIRGFLKSVIDYIPQTATPAAPAPRPALAEAPEVPNQRPTPSTQPAGSNRDFLARWNELVPERPVDPTLFTERQQAYQDPIFQTRFDEICGKFQELIKRGADLDYGDLFRKIKDTGVPFWKQALMNKLGWTVPGNKSGSRTTKNSLMDMMI